jgi:archaeosine-15-forming tRNA-guanine transglycosylase
VRDRGLVLVRGDTELRAGDEVLVLSDEDRGDVLRAVFEG